MDNKYSKYFYESERVGGKAVQVIKEECIDIFLKTLAQDVTVEPRFRCLFSILFSGGLRISEALSLKKSDITENPDGYLVGKVKVLKKGNLKNTKRKNKEVYRDFIVHPIFKPLFVKLLASRKPSERLFDRRSNYKARIVAQKVTRKIAYDNVIKTFGEELDCHSFRHSNLSFMLSKNQTQLVIAQTLKLELSTVVRYVHVRADLKMADLFS